MHCKVCFQEKQSLRLIILMKVWLPYSTFSKGKCCHMTILALIVLTLV